MYVRLQTSTHSSRKHALATASVAAAAPAVPDGYAIAAGVERLRKRRL